MIENARYVIEGTLLLGILTLMYKITYDSSQKIGRVYDRLDEHKESVEKSMNDNFVNKEVFKVEQEHMEKDFERLERKVDAGFHNIDKKLDRLIEKQN